MKGKGCHGSAIVCTLVIIGALNWGFIGLGGFFGGDWNIVKMILGSMPQLEWIVYILVGIAGVMKIVGCMCKSCKSSQGGKCEGENCHKENGSGSMPPQGQ